MLKDILVKDYEQVFGNSVLIVDGAPFRLHNFTGSRVEALNIGSQDYTILDFKKVNTLKVPNLGYYAYRGVSLYAVRYPFRLFKAGLTRDNVSVISPKDPEELPYGDDFFDKLRESKGVIQNLSNKALYNMYMGIYPAIAECLEMLQDGGYELPFDRQFTVSRDNTIRYKGVNVGHFNGNKIAFKNKYMYLNMALPKGMK